MPALVLLALLTAAPKPSLSGVVNADKARALPPPAREALAKDGFTVVEGEEQHFFSLYDRNAYEKVPSFISLDVVLHVFHVRFDDELAKAETARAIPALKAMASGQLAKALARWPDGGPVNARQEALALYHATALALLDEKAPLDARVAAKVQPVAKALRDAKDAAVKHPACPGPLDATRFKPRGHYDSWKLEGYFRAFTFYALCAFPLQGEGAARAKEVAVALAGDAPTRAQWDTLRGLVEYVGGTTDSEPLDLVAKGGPPVGVPTDTAMSRGLARPPRVPVFRLLGGAEVGDAVLFERTAGTPQRPFPSVLDVFASLGSAEARALLPATPEFAAALKEPLALGDSLSGRWLRILGLAVTRPAATTPAPFGTDGWARHTLVSAAGSYAELKHDTLLYVKQPLVMAQGGHDAELPASKLGGYVEPRPEVYRALLELTDGLKALGGGGGDELGGFLRFLVEVSDLELRNQPFPKAMDERLRTVGGELEHLSRTHGDESPPQALVADVFTLAFPDGPPRVLHVGTGGVDEVWVVAPRAGKRVLMRGGAYSYYEFAGEPAERLSDREWFRRLEENPPARPAWAQPVAREKKPRRRD
ncbi:MAG: hypothetical protein AMXMBFR34_51530 [Myxococcaceae bacterium]